ncbi:MAG: bile acid:sodium symporter family protein [Bacteroidaceae bacterium]|nr:bile acid:sodium symporter family protein [Bacteroidaceae bacterium]
MNSLFIVLPILTLLMFDLGLTLSIDDFKMFAKRPRPILVGLAGQIILLPLIAFLLAWATGLESVFFVGLILIACCPGGSSSNIFSMLAKGDVPLSVSLTAISSIVTLVTIPFVLDFAVSFVGNSGTSINLPIGNLLVQNILLMLVPIALGMTVKKYASNAAQKIEKVLSKLAFPALVFLAGAYFVQHRETIADNFAMLGLSVTALLLASILGGWILAKLTGLNGTEQKTIVIEVGMQNAAQAIAIASSPFIFNDSVYAIPAIIYALMMNIVLLIFVGCTKISKNNQ